MRHKVKGRKLGRSTPHRKATLQALANSLIKEQRIQTTVTKAKELRRFVEPLITRAKTDTTHNRRQVFASLRDKYAVTELFEVVAPEVGDRPGGYTRVLKLGFRTGDAAEMAMIELVDFSEYKPESQKDKKKKTRRAGKSNKPVTDSEETQKKSVTDKDSKPEDDSDSVKKKETSQTKAKKKKKEKKAKEPKEEDSEVTDDQSKETESK